MKTPKHSDACMESAANGTCRHDTDSAAGAQPFDEVPSVGELLKEGRNHPLSDEDRKRLKDKTMSHLSQLDTQRRKRKFVDAPAHLRCKANIRLKDNSQAQCGRYAKKDGLCLQHADKFPTALVGDKFPETLTLALCKCGDPVCSRYGFKEGTFPIGSGFDNGLALEIKRRYDSCSALGATTPWEQGKSYGKQIQRDADKVVIDALEKTLREVISAWLAHQEDNNSASRRRLIYAISAGTAAIKIKEGK